MKTYNSFISDSYHVKNTRLEIINLDLRFDFELITNDQLISCIKLSWIS